MESVLHAASATTLPRILKVLNRGEKKGKDQITLGSSMKCIAPINLGSENSSTGIGAGPTPLACTRSPQNGWSPKKGTIVVGHYIA